MAIIGLVRVVPVGAFFKNCGASLVADSATLSCLDAMETCAWMCVCVAFRSSINPSDPLNKRNVKRSNEAKTC